MKSHTVEFPSPTEIWAQPEPPEEMVWAVCSHVEGRDLQECDHCPMWEETPRPGSHKDDKVQRGCYGMAAEVCRIVFAVQAKLK